jgi:hypothetical protein
MEGPAGRVEDRYRVRDSLQRNGEGTGEEGGGDNGEAIRSHIGAERGWQLV